MEYGMGVQEALVRLSTSGCYKRLNHHGETSLPWPRQSEETRGHSSSTLPADGTTYDAAHKATSWADKSLFFHVSCQDPVVNALAVHVSF